MTEYITDLEREQRIQSQVDAFKIKEKAKRKEDNEFWVDLGLMTIYISHLRSFPYATTRTNVEHDLMGWEQKRDYGDEYFLPRCNGYSKSESVLDAIITHCEEFKKNL